MNRQLDSAEKTKRHPPRLLLEAITYRIPLPVTKIAVYARNDTYPICPRCSTSLDREYMSFCDRCGQKLNWDLFEYATVHRPGYKREQ